RRILLDGDAQLLQSLGRLVETLARQHVSQGRALHAGSGEPRVLVEVAEGTLAHDAARSRGRLTAEHAQQAGLARPVAPDQSGLVAGRDGERGVLEGQPTADLDTETSHLEHPPIFAAGGTVRKRSLRARLQHGSHLYPC